MSTFLRRRLGGKGLDVVRLLGLVDALVRVRLDDLLDVESDDVLSCGIRFCSVHEHASTPQPQRGWIIYWDIRAHIPILVTWSFPEAVDER